MLHCARRKWGGNPNAQIQWLLCSHPRENFAFAPNVPIALQQVVLLTYLKFVWFTKGRGSFSTNNGLGPSVADFFYLFVFCFALDEDEKEKYWTQKST